MAEFDDEQNARVTKLARSQPELALSLAEDLVERFPSSDRAWAALAYVYTVRKDYFAALAAMESALNLCPCKPANLFDVSRIYVKLGDFNNAIEYLSNCISSSNTLNNEYYLEASYFYRAFCLCKLSRFEDAEFDLHNVSDGFSLWIASGVQTKIDLKEVCQRKILD